MEEIVNVIWQTKISNKPVIQNETNNQFEFITKVLFKNFNFINHFDDQKYKTVLNRSILIYGAWDRHITEQQRKYFGTYKSNNFNYILFHLSNEALNHYTDYYSDANYVFRFHYDPEIKLPNVITFPLGFLSGYMNNDKKINLSTNRNTIICFIGDIKHDRQGLVNDISKINNNVIHCTKTWGDVNMMPFDKVIEVYKKTIFAPIPLGYGNRDECCRPYEALEWGCIPIIKKINEVDFYKQVLGDHPLPTINEWSEIQPLIDKLMSENIDDLIIKINRWYLEYKEKLAVQICDIVTNSLM